MKRRSGGKQHISIDALTPELQREFSHSLLPGVIGRRALAVRQSRTLGRILLDSPNANMKPRQGWKPGDMRQLRGIPVVGVPGGMGGAIAGTRPGDGLRIDEKDRGELPSERSADRTARPLPP